MSRLGARKFLVLTVLQIFVRQALSVTPASGLPERYRATFRTETTSMSAPPAIVPLPRRISRRRGELTFGSPVVIRTSGAAAREVALQLAAEFRRLGLTSKVDDPTPVPATIRLTQIRDRRELGAEGYELEVGAAGVTIVANTGAGLFYGAQTLKQLISYDGRKPRAVGFVRIVDWPEYRWRGLHLDVSRHFFPVKVVEQYIDIAARFKLNTFHWHLTDDQGWRIDIPQYPRLVSVGGCRAATQIPGSVAATAPRTPECAYYTAQDVRAVVAFAAARHVQVIPEIEGPGHSVEVLAAYPFLACGPGAYATLAYWGSTNYALCPTEQTFAFYDAVFRRLTQLFPAPILHIGGDEVPYYSWRGSPYVADLMRRRGLRNFAGVQAYFTRRLDAIAHKYHRRIAGWDEIEKAGTSRDAIVMVWTNRDAALTAARHGNDVVMTPSPPLYLDAYQGPREDEPPAFNRHLTTLRMVYEYDPAASLRAHRERAYILGAQANVWTEYIPTASQLWYMTYPRALAVAELCWTPVAAKHWTDFKHRAGIALQRLEPLAITFRLPEVTFRIEPLGVAATATNLNTYRARSPARSSNITVALEQIVPNATIHYTLNGTTPTPNSPVYQHPLHLDVRGNRRHITAAAWLRGHRPSAPSSLTITPH